MNPLHILAWARIGAFFAVIAAIAFAAFWFWRRRDTMTAASVASYIKEETVLGAPARAVDSAISAATSREETLGGWLAEKFDPATREVNRQLSTPKSVVTPSYPDYYDISP